MIEWTTELIIYLTTLAFMFLFGYVIGMVQLYNDIEKEREQ